MFILGVIQIYFNNTLHRIMSIVHSHLKKSYEYEFQQNCCCFKSCYKSRNIGVSTLRCAKKLCAVLHSAEFLFANFFRMTPTNAAQNGVEVVLCNIAGSFDFAQCYIARSRDLLHSMKSTPFCAA
jgi:hypothetical protein